MLEIACPVDNAAANDRQVRRRVYKLVFRAGEEVAVRNDQVSQLTGHDLTLGAFLVREPRHLLCPHAQRGITVKEIPLGI